jgi:hypothetical protein
MQRQQRYRLPGVPKDQGVRTLENAAKKEADSNL